MRLIDHLRDTGMTNREAKAALTSGKIYVEDAPTADASREVAPADVAIRMNAPRAHPWRDVVIVFRDAHLAIVAKPSGVLAVPAANRRGTPSVIGHVRRALATALAVHRIDEGTSGLMLVARTESAQHDLKALFFDHDIERSYLAIVAGRFPREGIRHESILVRNRGDGLRGSRGVDSHHDGKRAASHFETVRAIGTRQTLVRARLETGRTHQIRIHLAELGFPILGDDLYADDRSARAAPRLALHASVLGFRHPVTSVVHRFCAPLADDLNRLIRRLATTR